MISLEHLEESINSAQTDLEKIEALNTLANAVRNTDLIRCKKLADQSLQLVQPYLHSTQLSSEESLAYQSQHAESLWLLGFAEYRQSNYQNALSLYQEALDIFKTVEDKRSVARVLHTIGNVHWYLSDFKKSIENHQESLTFYESEDDLFHMSYVINSIGQVYFSLGDFTASLSHFQKSLILSESVNDTIGKANALNSMGMIHFSQHHFSEALENYTSSYKLFEEIGDHSSVSKLLGNIGIVLGETGNYSEAISNFQRGLSVFREMGDKRMESTMLHNLAQVNFKLGNYSKAVEFFESSLVISKMHDIGGGVVTDLLGLGQTYLKLFDVERAEYHLLEARTLCEKIGLKSTQLEILKSLAELYSLKRDFQKAFEFHQEFYSAERLLYSDETQQKLNRLQLSFEIKQAQREAELLKEKNQSLEAAMAEISRLKELVTMCAWTGQIKMNGKWVRVEEYLQKIFGIAVSHGISEEAAQKLRDEIHALKKKQVE